MPSEVKDNPAQSRFDLATPDGVAYVVYKREGRRVVLIHTEVPEALSGQGIGSKLVRGTLDQLRADGDEIVPRCEFVAAYIARHPEYEDMIAT